MIPVHPRRDWLVSLQAALQAERSRLPDQVYAVADTSLRRVAQVGAIGLAGSLETLAAAGHAPDWLAPVVGIVGVQVAHRLGGWLTASAARAAHLRGTGPGMVPEDYGCVIWPAPRLHPGLWFAAWAHRSLTGPVVGLPTASGDPEALQAFFDGMAPATWLLDAKALRAQGWESLRDGAWQSVQSVLAAPPQPDHMPLSAGSPALRFQFRRVVLWDHDGRRAWMRPDGPAEVWRLPVGYVAAQRVRMPWGAAVLLAQTAGTWRLGGPGALCATAGEAAALAQAAAVRAGAVPVAVIRRDPVVRRDPVDPPPDWGPRLRQDPAQPAQVRLQPVPGMLALGPPQPDFGAQAAAWVRIAGSGGRWHAAWPIADGWVRPVCRWTGTAWEPAAWPTAAAAGVALAQHGLWGQVGLRPPGPRPGR